MSFQTLEDAVALGTGIERSFLCPVHGDRNASASVNVLKGVWVCYTCGASGRIDVDRIDIDPETVVRELRKFTHVVEDETRYYAENWLALYDGTGPGDYWLSRFTTDACKQFRLGEDPNGEWATYPLRDNQGRILGLVRRALADQPEKYKYPHGVDITHFLFNYHACQNDIVVLTEGATDTIAAWEAGYDAMAAYGSRASAKQKLAMHRYAPKAVLLAHDADSAGDQAAKTWEKAMEGTVCVRVTWHPSLGKDLASMSLPSRHKVLAEAAAEANRALARNTSDQVGSKTCESNERTTRRTVSIRRSKSSARPSESRPRLRIVSASPTST